MNNQDSETKIGEVRLGKFRANAVALILTLVIAVPVFAVALSLPHFNGFSPHHLPIFFSSLFLLAVLHELLHALAFHYWGRVPRSGLKIGFHLKALLPYCFCKVPVTMKVFRIAVLFPLYVTGGVCIIAMLIYPSVLTAAITTLAISSSIGDMWVFVKARKFSSDSLVKDHPSEVGFDVFQPTTGFLKNHPPQSFRD